MYSFFHSEFDEPFLSQQKSYYFLHMMKGMKWGNKRKKSENELIFEERKEWKIALHEEKKNVILFKNSFSFNLELLFHFRYQNLSFWLEFTVFTYLVLLERKIGGEGGMNKKKTNKWMSYYVRRLPTLFFRLTWLYIEIQESTCNIVIGFVVRESEWEKRDDADDECDLYHQTMAVWINFLLLMEEMKPRKKGIRKRSFFFDPHPFLHISLSMYFVRGKEGKRKEKERKDLM